MTENLLEYEAKIEKKSNFLFSNILIFFLFSIIFAGTYFLYKQTKDFDLAKAKINNISLELSEINEKYQDLVKKIEKKDFVAPNININDQNIIENKNAELKEKLLLISCLVELKNVIDNNDDVIDSCYVIFSTKDEFIKNKFGKIDLTKIANNSYVKLKNSFKLISKNLQENLTKQKLIEFKIPTKLAIYITKFFSWHKINNENSENITKSEKALVNCEKYIEEKKICLMIDELKIFDDIDIVREWKENAEIYCSNLDSINQALNYLLKRER